jgi:hypothetical protein
MTVHAAKGLEFPMVIIPDLNRRPPSRTQVGKPIRLYASELGRPEDWNYHEGEIPVWPVEIPELDYRKTHSPVGYLLTFSRGETDWRIWRRTDAFFMWVVQEPGVISF